MKKLLRYSEFIQFFKQLHLSVFHNFNVAMISELYRVVQKSGTPYYFCDKCRKCTPILTISSLLKQEIYGA